jgi:hypothetical protein
MAKKSRLCLTIKEKIPLADLPKNPMPSLTEETRGLEGSSRLACLTHPRIREICILRSNRREESSSKQKVSVFLQALDRK